MTRAPWCSATSYMTSPTCTTFSPDWPSAARWRVALSVGVNSQREMRSVRMRFTSSGMRRLNERRPASTWATGICSLTAASAPARVELVSP
ncbi:Uncharacterised protein [Bordetella pertussis]|nr:Uncharacterised protein [Bordetella pertussis]